MTESSVAAPRIGIERHVVKLVHITTVAQTLGFFGGQIDFLRDNGFAVEAICAADAFSGQMAESIHAPIHSVGLTRDINAVGDTRALREIVTLLRTIRPHIVHAHTPKAALLGSVAARMAGVPIVITSIFGLPQMTKSGITRRLLDTATRISCRLADRVWCDSYSMRDYVQGSRLCSPGKLVVFGHGSVRGVDAVDEFSPDVHGRDDRLLVRRRNGMPDDALVLGYAGRLVGDKGLGELADAWRSLRVSHPSLHLLLVGPLEAKDPLRLGDFEMFNTDERVHLTGHRVDVPAHFAAMDIFAMPSYREGFGMTNLEAAAMGLPVVSTRIPGCVDSVQDGVTGTLVPARDAGALAAAIRAYLDDPSLAAAHGDAGRNRALRDFRPEGIWEDSLQTYLKLMSDRGLAGTAAHQAMTK